MTEEARILEGQLRECYGRVVYSHKTHERCADILLTRLSRIKIAQILLSALTTGTLLSVLFGTGTLVVAIGALFSTTLLVLNAYTKDYNLGELAQKHRQAGADIWIIREEYLSLLTDLRMNIAPVNDIRARRDQLLKDLYAVYTGAPSANNKAYEEAQNALQNLEDMTFSDAEVDAFLPRELKRKQEERGT